MRQLVYNNNGVLTHSLKTELHKSFTMKEVGPAKQILGMKITKNKANKKLGYSIENYGKKS